MATLHCTRCGQDREAMAFQPFPNELGQRVYAEICGICWGEWLRYQQQLINHYGLDLRDPKAKEFLLRNMNEFLFGPASAHS
ncbi:MAG TPA: oxidative damage protection protein [Gemmatimonadales bacterium]|nr:oxidative damage protection protein [Gemmatimonadales bacterium]